MHDHLSVEERKFGPRKKRLSEFQLKLYYVVRENPGIHFRGLGRAVQSSSSGRLRHHIDKLKKERLVNEIAGGHFKCFFVVGDHDYALELVMARLSHSTAHRIGELLLAHPMDCAELRSALGCSAPTLSYHVGCLLRAGDIQREQLGKYARYSLVNPELIRRALMTPEAD